MTFETVQLFIIEDFHEMSLLSRIFLSLVCKERNMKIIKTVRFDKVWSYLVSKSKKLQITKVNWHYLNINKCVSNDLLSEIKSHNKNYRSCQSDLRDSQAISIEMDWKIACLSGRMRGKYYGTKLRYRQFMPADYK